MLVRAKREPFTRLLYFARSPSPPPKNPVLSFRLSCANLLLRHSRPVTTVLLSFFMPCGKLLCFLPKETHCASPTAAAGAEDRRRFSLLHHLAAAVGEVQRVSLGTMCKYCHKEQCPESTARSVQVFTKASFSLTPCTALRFFLREKAKGGIRSRPAHGAKFPGLKVRIKAQGCKPRKNF